MTQKGPVTGTWQLKNGAAMMEEPRVTQHFSQVVEKLGPTEKNGKSVRSVIFLFPPRIWGIILTIKLISRKNSIVHKNLPDRVSNFFFTTP